VRTGLRIGLIVGGGLALQFLLGALLGDDGHEAWSRPLGFALVFMVVFPIVYWRQKRKAERE